MSLRTINAVHQSRIEPRYRHLAQTLAIFANDDGAEIWPGIHRLTQALGVEERAVREGLHALVENRILVRDGFRHRARRFRFDMERLLSYEPASDHSGTTRRDAARRREASKQPAISAEGDPCTVVQGSSATIEARSLHHGAATPAPPRRDPCTLVPPPLHRGAPDLNDLNDLNEITGADAPGHVQPLHSQEVLPASRSAPQTARDSCATGDETNNPGFVKVGDIYAAIAGRALQRALLEKDETPANLTKHLRNICREEAVAYEDDRLQPALDAARRARDQAARDFFERVRAISPQPHQSTPRKRRGDR